MTTIISKIMSLMTWKVLTLTIVIGILTAVSVTQTQRLALLRDDAAEAHRQLSDIMKENYAVRSQLKEMTLQAHPYIQTGQVGPTASLELQCMQFQGLLPHPTGDTEKSQE